MLEAARAHARAIVAGAPAMPVSAAAATGSRVTRAQRGRRADPDRPKAAAVAGAGAFFVSLGILHLKVFGIVRQSFIANYLGATRRRRRVQRGDPDPGPPAEPVR